MFVLKTTPFSGRNGNMNMHSQYPKIITEITERAQRDELRHFDLSSFMSDINLYDVYQKIDRTMKFFSVYVLEELLEDDFWEDSRYMDKEDVNLCSLVEAEARKYWGGRSREHLKLIGEQVELLKNDPEYKKMNNSDLRDRVIEDLNQQVYPEAIERVKEEYQFMYEDEWEKYWKKEDPFKPRKEFRYNRKYEMPPPFNNWDRRNPWQQYYFAKDKDDIFYYTQGGVGGSYQRYNHGFYGHLFALLNRENPVSTYFFIYDSQNNFIFQRKEESLWLNFMDLTGNFKIDLDESREILKDVNEIEMKRRWHER
ncbi:MAG: hypothetical protein Q7J27_00980 [Syntrophales bacterium]|nr:hypothetical protein [Syntrophales bacterium]